MGRWAALLLGLLGCGERESLPTTATHCTTPVYIPCSTHAVCCTAEPDGDYCWLEDRAGRKAYCDGLDCTCARRLMQLDHCPDSGGSGAPDGLCE